MRILIIEDNRDAADSLQMLLELSGHEVVVSYSGQEGLAAARRLRPEVVLCDIGLPGGMDGYDLARVMREEIPESHLIALTGYGQEEDQLEARQAGFHRHLTKPIEPSKLVDLLDKLPAAPV